MEGESVDLVQELYAAKLDALATSYQEMEKDLFNIMSNYWYMIQIAGHGQKLLDKEYKNAEEYWKKMQKKYKIY
jgi:hypothetical protein